MGKRISSKIKQRALDELKQGAKQRVVAKKYGVSLATIGVWKRTSRPKPLATKPIKNFPNHNDLLKGRVDLLEKENVRLKCKLADLMMKWGV